THSVIKQALLFLRLHSLLNFRRQVLNAANVSCHRPQVFVRSKFSIGEHSSAPDSMLCYPEDLRFCVLGAELVQLRNWREKRITIFFRVVGIAMTTRAVALKEFASRNQVFITRSNRVGGR